MKRGYVYILASQKNGTLYTGVTANLCHRVREHKLGKKEGFTKKYRVKRLVYYEAFDSMFDAISREKQIKTYQRRWKIELIEEENPGWNELYYKVCGEL